mmetsp:Transcript_26251/g.63968  ORF Transcript_26251/g.63968 Transcript_26251/m.63968 type:complete len:266 (+) Transcript_26251:174-971(+)
MTEEEKVEKKKTKKTKTKTKKKKVKKKKAKEEEPPAPTEPSDDDTLNLDFSIISCRNLLVGDVRSSDPYVRILLGEKLLHKTKHVTKSLNPVFSAGKENEFSAPINYGELKKAGGLSIEVVDWDRIGSDDLIGFATIEPPRLLELSKCPKTSSIELQVPPGRKETEAGFIDVVIFDPKNRDNLENEPQTKKDKVKSKDPSESTAEESKDPAEATAEPSANETIQLSFKVSSCRNLLKGDYSSSDPYIKFFMGKKELHRTKNLLKT